MYYRENWYCKIFWFACLEKAFPKKRNMFKNLSHELHICSVDCHISYSTVAPTFPPSRATETAFAQGGTEKRFPAALLAQGPWYRAAPAQAAAWCICLQAEGRAAFPRS